MLIFDVTALFTSLPYDSTLDFLEWKNYTSLIQFPIPILHFPNLLRLCVKSNVFSLNSRSISKSLRLLREAPDHHIWPTYSCRRYRLYCWLPVLRTLFIGLDISTSYLHFIITIFRATTLSGFSSSTSLQSVLVGACFLLTTVKKLSYILIRWYMWTI